MGQPSILVIHPKMSTERREKGKHTQLAQEDIYLCLSPMPAQGHFSFQKSSSDGRLTKHSSASICLLSARRQSLTSTMDSATDVLYQS
jgi:hypothetical protein